MSTTAKPLAIRPTQAFLDYVQDHSLDVLSAEGVKGKE